MLKISISPGSLSMPVFDIQRAGCKLPSDAQVVQQQFPHKKPGEVAISADDLLPLLSYILIQASVHFTNLSQK